MPSEARQKRVALARKRVVNVLRTAVVANDRTLEQKIADAGPTNQRVEPHIVTEARNALVQEGRVVWEEKAGAPWFSLAETGGAEKEKRIETLLPIYQKTQAGDFKLRIGQTLEIAIYRGLRAAKHQFLGHFADLEEHGDAQPYKKQEPPLTISGNTITKGGPLDFVVFGAGGPAGVEAKNYRQWIYPDRAQVRELLSKCCDLNAVPVLIARRFPFITFRLLNLSGVVVHQMYNQLYPKADEELAAQVRAKDTLGYHDVRASNEPDARLTKFLTTNLPRVVEESRPTFEHFVEVHRAYAGGKMKYREWVRDILVMAGWWKDKFEGEPEEVWGWQGHEGGEGDL